MNRRNPKGAVASAAYLLLALSSSAPQLALALPGDQEQPVDLEADSADLDDKRGISIYRGDVRYAQGSIRMSSKVMTIYNPDGELSKVVLEDGPARYSWLPKKGDERVKARGKTIEYYADKDQVVVVGDAEVVQAGDTFRAERIVYDMKNDRVKAGTAAKPAKGAAKGAADKPRSRVRMTFQPKAKK
ncbi:lipopolysaccharide transport periplasmic protein LptA [Endothiovibrio diazotrophicus]